MVRATKRPTSVKGSGNLITVIPRAPSGLSAASRRTWAQFWSSDLASLLVPDIDLAALERLWTQYDERARLSAVVRKEPMVQGYKGQPRPNPLVNRVAALDVQIAAGEDRFGMSPRARQRLGVTARDTIAEFNRAFAEAGEEDDDDPDTFAESDANAMDRRAG